MRLVAGPDGAELEALQATARAERSDPQGPVYMVAVSDGEQSAFTFHGPGASRVETTRDAGNVLIDLPPEPEDPSDTLSEPLDDASFSWGAKRLAKGERAAVAAFVTNAAFTDFRFDAPRLLEGQSGSVAVEAVCHGSGSRALWAAAGEQAGRGVRADRLAAGATSQGLAAEAGIVGVMGLHTAIVSCVTVCRYDWSAPGGRTGGLEVTGPLVQTGSRVFAGAAGTWAFKFTGVQAAAALAVFAPIGDDWRLFEPPVVGDNVPQLAPDPPPR